MFARIAVLRSEVLTKQALMLALEEQLDFQTGFGRNWDALLDELSSCLERDPLPIVIVVAHSAEDEWRPVVAMLSEIVAGVAAIDPSFDIQLFVDPSWRPVLES